MFVLIPYGNYFPIPGWHLLYDNDGLVFALVSRISVCHTRSGRIYSHIRS